MKRIAHLKLECKHCGKWTNVYVVEDGASSADVKCEYCKKVFTFESGMMYDPIGYVPEIPSWAIINENDTAKEKEKEKKNNIIIIRCKNCGWDNTGKNTKCEKCNASLNGSPGGQNLSNDASPVGSFDPKETALGCPKCGYPMKKGGKPCPECGYVFDDEKQDAPVNQEKPCEAPQPVPIPEPKPTPNVSQPTGKTCTSCRTSIPETARFCTNCGASLIKENNHLEGTINPWVVAEQIQTPECLLTVISREGESVKNSQLRLSGKEIQLNRDNTEPGNQTITSKLQAELIFENDKWYLQDKSALKTTYIYAGEKKELKPGDVIILGNRSFKFDFYRNME